LIGLVAFYIRIVMNIAVYLVAGLVRLNIDHAASKK